MCFDIITSLTTFIINITTSIALYTIAYKHKDVFISKQLKIISIFFIFVGFMQIWDAIFWTYDANTKVNIYSTKLAMIWNHLQPIVLAILIYLFIGKLTIPSMIILFIYLVMIVYYSVNGWKTLKGTEVTNKTCGSLYWQWNYMKGYKIVYTIFLLCLLLLVQQQFTGWIRMLTMFIILTTFFFSFYKYRKMASEGRFWCYYTEFCPIFFLIGARF